MIYYKTVRVKDSKLVSSFVDFENLQVEYKLNEFVYSRVDNPAYGLFVATTPIDALQSVCSNFLSDSNGSFFYLGYEFKVYECEVIFPSSEIDLMPNTDYYITMMSRIVPGTTLKNFLTFEKSGNLREQYKIVDGVKLTRQLINKHELFN